MKWHSLVNRTSKTFFKPNFYGLTPLCLSAFVSKQPACGLDLQSLVFHDLRSDSSLSRVTNAILIPPNEFD